MKIICTEKEYYDLQEVITAGCCWIGSGEGRKQKTNKKGGLVDLEKFRMATNLFGSKSKIEWEILKDD